MTESGEDCRQDTEKGHSPISYCMQTKSCLPLLNWCALTARTVPHQEGIRITRQYNRSTITCALLEFLV